MNAWGIVFAVLLVAVASVAIVTAEGARDPAGGGTAPPAATFWQNDSYGYVATLAPNVVYNTTTISNLTDPLYLPITQSVDFTLYYSLATDRPARLALGGGLTVIASGTTWAMTISQQTIPTTSAEGVLLQGRVDYTLNVTSVVRLISEAQNETGTFGAPSSLAIEPTLTGSVTVNNVTQPLAFRPALDLAVSSSSISLGPLATGVRGAIGDPHPLGAGVSGSLLVGLSLLAGLSVATVLVGRVWARQRVPDREARFERRVRAYSEGVVDTLNVPSYTELVAVRDWVDLVKVADTIGRPILRYRGRGPAELPPLFFVKDGSTCYAYRGTNDR